MAAAAAAAAAAAQGFPKKPHFVFPEQSSHIQQIPSKSHSNTLCKTSTIVVLLLAIPLFPSQAPDFITQSLFTEFWEIIHLLFIGIAISYGLFGRRTAQIPPDKIVDSCVDDDSSSYLSGISHLHSIFDDGYEITCGSDEKEDYGQFLGKGSARVEEISGGNGETVNQSWCSQYSKGKSLVVVSNGKYFLDGSSDFKPLNLPVRSLRSKPVDVDSSELRNRIEASSKTEASSNDDDDDDDDNDKVVRIRGVVPINLEKKFDEVAGRSSIPWRSRSWRMRNVGESSRPAHCRPHSVGEFEFENLKFSGSPELGSRKVERKRVFKHPHPKIAPLNVEASFDGPKKQLFSNDASSDTGRLGGLENSQKNLVHTSISEEELGKEKRGIECLDVDKKYSGLVKVSSRPKSVRTIKPNRYIKNQKEHSLSQIDGELERMCTNSETDSLESGEEAGNRPSNHQNEEFDRVFPVPKPKPTLSEFHKEEKHDLDAQNTEEDIQDKFDKSSVGDHVGANVDNDSELEGSEVDRKADEFIAKFRKQIRLQKTS
ncbi:hypothetical protein ACS0TY_019583 [Phlomoides rotata]